MPETISCQPSCCSTPQTTNIPGTPGGPGNDGINGLNAYTTITADFTIPAVGSNVTVAVTNANWMVEGQNIVMEGPASFQVVSVTSSTSVILKFLGYIYDLSPGVTIASGTGVSPSGPQPFTALKATATLNFGNTLAQTSADLTLAVPGASVGDIVCLGIPNSAVNADSCYTAWISAVDVCTIRFNNYSAAPINPASADFSVLIIPV